MSESILHDGPRGRSMKLFWFSEGEYKLQEVMKVINRGLHEVF